MVKRKKSSQIGERAVLLVEKIFNEVNWVCNRLYHDFGIDLHVKVFESEQAMPWEFHVQVKGSQSLHTSKGHIQYSIDTKNLKDWYDSPLPVLLVVCDVRNERAYYLWVKEYLDELNKTYSSKLESLRGELGELVFTRESLEMKGEHSYELDEAITRIEGQVKKLDWREKTKVKLQIPVTNDLAINLHGLFNDFKRKTLMNNAWKVIGIVETQICEEPVYYNSPYYQPLPKLDPSIKKPALAQCILCRNYFWIEEDIAIAWEFTKIYEPSPHEPAVYLCEVPEEFCPVCASGEGMLEQCERCGRYAVLPFEEVYEDWDDPLVSRDEARQLCYECLEELRRLREKGSNI